MARTVYILHIQQDNGGQGFYAVPDQMHVFEHKKDAVAAKKLFDERHKEMYGDQWDWIPCDIIARRVNNEPVKPNY